MLTSFADEICGTLARLLAYVMTLALLAAGGIALWKQLPDATAMEPSENSGWSLADRSAPAFAISQFNSPDKTGPYEIFRHPGGGRKDVFRWSGTDRKPAAELELYRPGAELHQASPALADIARRMDPDGARELETAGIIDSKFGPVTLLRLVGGDGNTRSCLGFIKRIEDPNFRIRAGPARATICRPAARRSAAC